MVEKRQEPEVETWMNAAPGMVVVKRLDHRGDFTKDEVVYSGKSLHITPQERRMNQEMAASADQDVFQNGFMTPLRLVGSAEEEREIAANPNLMSESDMRGLFKGHWKSFDAKLATITNTVALQRMLAMAEDPEIDASVRQVQRIKDRLGEVSPTGNRVIEVEQAGSAAVMGNRPRMTGN